MARPNLSFALLLGLSLALVVAIVWSTHHLLLAGAPTVAAGGPWPGFSCLLLPLGDDLVPHLASYAFILAGAAGASVALRALVRQRRQTHLLLRACLAARSSQRAAVEPLARRLGLQNRLDLVELDAPLAFCYGYLRPRVLVSTGLLERLAGPELEALLLHEREHLRQRDPLKVALGRLLASALFFVPILGALYHRYLVEKELAADGAAIAERGDPTDLSAALVRLIEGGGLRQPVPGIGAGEALEARIDALLGEPVKVGLPLGPGGFAASTIAAILAALPLVAAPPPSDVVVSHHNIVAGCHLRPGGGTARAHEDVPRPANGGPAPGPLRVGAR